MKKKRILLLLSSGLVLVATILVISACQKNKSSYSFETAKVERTSITNTISATGTIEATTTVEVGTQVSGVIEDIYVDFNTHVKKGQLLAEIDKTALQSSVDEASASLDNAIAELEYQESSYNRIKALSDKKLVASADYDLARYNYEKAKSSLKSAQARYDKALVNLNYAKIYSPIDGVILNRAVDEGQTVAASFNTPTLFSIANDLTQMQVEADIDEADIGQVKAGQRVEFEVDAFQDDIFNGEVLEVRLQPVESSNVITYTVIIDAPNPDLKLMPGMTATITAFVEEVDNALSIPGKALRFSPDREVIMAYMDEQGIDLPRPGMGESGPGDARVTGTSGASSDRVATGGGLPSGVGMMRMSDSEAMPENISMIWVKDGDLIKPVQVETGVSDGSNTEILSGLKEGEDVVISMSADVEKKKAESTTSSPFMPQRPGGGK